MIAEHCSRKALSPDGLGAEIYAAADSGEITDHEAGMLVRSLVSAGVDTTVHALSALLHALAAHPDQWKRLRDNRDLVRPAFEEALRYGSPVQTFFRTTTRPVEIGGTTIPDGEKILLFLGAANRDPREWRDPHRFDIGRRAVGHVAFGSGIHACVGAAFARLEAESLLTAMTRQIDGIEPAGPAQPLRNNTLRGWTSLPLRVHAAVDHGCSISVSKPVIATTSSAAIHSAVITERAGSLPRRTPRQFVQPQRPTRATAVSFRASTRPYAVVHMASNEPTYNHATVRPLAPTSAAAHSANGEKRSMSAANTVASSGDARNRHA